MQIISEIYHNFPEQRTLLITHSNSALNDLFAKIMERDIDERYLLRLGRGSEDVASESDMGKFGRVNYMLQRRLTLLDEVAALARSMAMSDDVAYTCETSGHFFLAHVLSRWEKFASDVQAAQRAGVAAEELNGFVRAHFPFTMYFQERSEKQAKIWAQYYQNSAAMAVVAADAAAPVDAAAAPAAAGGDAMELDDGTDGAAAAAVAAPAAVAVVDSQVAPSSLFRGSSLTEDMSIAVSCFADLQQTFVELEETRPFELLRTYKDRSNYLLTKHAKIIAMTCTHAAIKRKDMVDLNFRFDNIVMEESAQILEIETFIPSVHTNSNSAATTGPSGAAVRAATDGLMAHFFYFYFLRVLILSFCFYHVLVASMLLQRADSESGNRLKRIILLGDHHQLPPVIKVRSQSPGEGKAHEARAEQTRVLVWLHCSVCRDALLTPRCSLPFSFPSVSSPSSSHRTAPSRSTATWTSLSSRASSVSACPTCSSTRRAACAAVWLRYGTGSTLTSETCQPSSRTPPTSPQTPVSRTSSN